MGPAMGSILVGVFLHPHAAERLAAAVSHTSSRWASQLCQAGLAAAQGAAGLQAHPLYLLREPGPQLCVRKTALDCGGSLKVTAQCQLR